MGVLILNNAGEPLTIHNFFINESRGPGYYGDIKYVLPTNGRQLLSNSIFTRETMKELKPLEVHVKINGKKRLVLHHDDFEKNKAIIFVMENEEKLEVYVVPRKAERGFADRIWGMLPSCGPAANIEALIDASKPLKP